MDHGHAAVAPEEVDASEASEDGEGGEGSRRDPLRGDDFRWNGGVGALVWASPGDGVPHRGLDPVAENCAGKRLGVLDGQEATPQLRRGEYAGNEISVEVDGEDICQRNKGRGDRERRIRQQQES